MLRIGIVSYLSCDHTVSVMILDGILGSWRTVPGMLKPPRLHPPQGGLLHVSTQELCYNKGFTDDRTASTPIHGVKLLDHNLLVDR